MKLLPALVIVAFGVAPAVIASTSHAETRFTIVDSSATNQIALGVRNYTVSPDIGWVFTPSRNFDNGIHFFIHSPLWPHDSAHDAAWTLDFAAPFNSLITAGNYSNMQRFPFQDSNRPGLDFLGNGHADNTLAGSFYVLEATYGTGGSVISFAANITYYGHTLPSQYAILELRFNSTVPEPSTILPTIGVLLAFATRRRQAIHNRVNEPVGVDH